MRRENEKKVGNYDQHRRNVPLTIVHFWEAEFTIKETKSLLKSNFVLTRQFKVFLFKNYFEKQTAKSYTNNKTNNKLHALHFTIIH